MPDWGADRRREFHGRLEYGGTWTNQEVMLHGFNYIPSHRRRPRLQPGG